MRIGVDLGGSKIEAIALADDGRILARQRVAAPRGDYRRSVLGIRDLVLAVEAQAGTTGSPGTRGSLGVGIPGTVSPATGLVKNANSVWLIGHALDKDLAEALGRPVRLANDANCFALSEAMDGAGAGYNTVFGVILGTGCGAGIVINGHALVGPNAIAGEWGHNPLPWPMPDELPGPACYCGLRGCNETWISGTGLENDFTRATGLQLDAEDIVARADTGDAEAEAALRRLETRLARALAAVLNLLDPDVIVLGGGLSNLDRLYQSVPQLWETWAFSDTIVTPLKRNLHGDSSGVRGAAWLWAIGERAIGERASGERLP
ncbi:ROK family protein [Ferrovibrio sp.]|uniref:ROK family protein n=1 Tax=Ferrovibrio sp. TaxID=1917215 RepID=UPI0035B4E32E